MKKLLSFALALIMLMPFTVFEINASETAYNGTVYLSYETDGNIEIEIDGIRYKAVDVSEEPLTVEYTASGVDNVGSIFALNGKQIAVLASGSNTISVTHDMLSDGENEITVLLYKGSGTFDETKVYGTYNLDDITIESFAVKNAVGKQFSLTLNKYMPVKGKSGVTVESGEYNGTAVNLGDGWNSSNNMGGTTLTQPVKIGFAFTPETESGEASFRVDTTELSDGTHEVKFYDTASGKYLDKTESVTVCNNAPKVDFPFSSGQTIYKKAYTVKVNDNPAHIANVRIFIDETREKTAYNEQEFELDFSSYKTGRHTVSVISTDKLGNTEYTYIFVNLAEVPVEAPNIENGFVTSSNTVYGVNLIRNINFYTNPVGEYSMKSLRSSDEKLENAEDLGTTETKAIGNALPYQSFVVDVSDITGNAVISLSAETGNGERYDTSVWNYKTESWDILSVAESGENSSVKVDLAVYSKDGKMRVNVNEHVVGNGSDTMLWFTDPQYYSRYTELNMYYKAIVDYAVEEYEKGNIGYVTFTGDLVDQVNTSIGTVEEANREYQTASDMQKILEDAGVPHGVVAGNHDVAHKTLDYSYYLKYFPASRYSDCEWYGGALNNGVHHFDLITVGGYDFVVLYLGYGREVDDDALVWANSVLSAYSDRNAIIATHEYLGTNGEHASENAQKIWDLIAVPNDNVKMIICGHIDGASDTMRNVEGTDRYVLEILHDYQFASIGEGPAFTENGCNEDGDAFLRLMTFTESGQLVMKTYSPFYDLDSYYSDTDENFVRDISLSTETRTIKTTSFNVGVNITEIVNGASSGYDAYFAMDEKGGLSELVTEKAGYNKYEYDKSEKEYSSDFEIYKEPWYSGVSSSFTYGENPYIPDDSVVVLGHNLLPAKSSGAYRTSGNTDYEFNVAEDGSCTLVSNGTYNWVTVCAKKADRIKVGDYPYLFFSITAEPHTNWNLYFISSTGKEYGFSQNAIEKFGYPDYTSATDLKGSWSGYIDLREFYSESDCSGGIYIVAATAGHTVKVNYMFMGDIIGNTVTFTVNENTKKSILVQSGTIVDEPDAPFVAHKTFEGWKDESGSIVSFPYTVTEDTELTAVFKDRAEKDDTVYYNDETELAAITERFENESPKSESSTEEVKEESGNAVIFAVIGAVILICIAAAVIVIIKKRKK